MKRKVSSLLIALTMVFTMMPVTAFAGAADVTINTKNFPDAKFRAAVTELCDSNKDGVLSQAEIAACIMLNIKDRDIESISGIEHFTSLQQLDCSDNDISQKPQLPLNLKELDFSDNELVVMPALPLTLEILSFEDNNLSGILDLSKHSSMKRLNLKDNKFTGVKLSAEAPYEYINVSKNYLMGINHNFGVSGRPDISWDGVNFVYYSQKEDCVMLGHSYASPVVKRATFTKNGSSSQKCKRCGEVISNPLGKVKTPKLSKTAYTYNGKSKKPAVTVKDIYGNILANKTDYTVKYASGRTKVGKYKVTVTLKGNYSGTKSVYFKINPQTTSISKLTKSKKAFTVKWKKKSTQVTGYQIRYSTSSKMTGAKKVNVKSTKSTSKKITKLKAKKTYYVQIRTYKTVKGKNYYSSWSKVKKIKTK